jgi:hypothetical protein
VLEAREPGVLVPALGGDLLGGVLVRGGEEFRGIEVLARKAYRLLRT